MKKKIIAGIIVGLFLLVGVAGVSTYNHGNDVIGKNTMIMVSHSQYWTGEELQVIAQLRDWQGDPIAVTNCTVDIWYPDKSPFVSGALTDDSMEATTASHYYTDVVPSIEGVYQYMVTCRYGNNKQSSVASSFHVSPALNMQKVINVSIAELSSQELAHFGAVQVNISGINNDLAVVKTDLSTVILNLSAIDDDTNYIRSNMATSANQDIIIAQGNNVLSNLSAIESFCGDAVTSGSQLCLWVSEIKDKVIEVNSTIQQNAVYLSEINSTTHSTYDYMTGTLATNVNDIELAVGNIANDVTTLLGITQRTEANTVQINATVNQIQINQQEQVYMVVTS